MENEMILIGKNNLIEGIAKLLVGMGMTAPLATMVASEATDKIINGLPLKPKYEVRNTGYYSYIIDTSTGKPFSHGYDIEADADIECERLNAKVSKW